VALDDAHAGRPDQDPGREEGYDEGLAEPLADGTHECRQGENRRDLEKAAHAFDL